LLIDSGTAIDNILCTYYFSLIDSGIAVDSILYAYYFSLIDLRTVIDNILIQNNFMLLDLGTTVDNILLLSYFSLIDSGTIDDNIFIKAYLTIKERRRMIESYLRIRNSFIISDTRIIEDLITNTYVKSPEDIIHSTDNVFALQTAIYQLINIFDEPESTELIKLIIRLDWRNKREEYLAKKWRENLRLKINL